MREQKREQKRERKVWNHIVEQASESKMLLASIVLAIFLVLGVLSYGVIEQGREFQQSADRQNDLLELNQRNIDLITSCTTPDGECYGRLRDDPAQAAIINALVSRITNSIVCVLRILPTERTDSRVDTCLEGTP